MDYPWCNAEYRALTLKHADAPPAPAPKRKPADNASVEAYQAYQKRLGIFRSLADQWKEKPLKTKRLARESQRLYEVEMEFIHGNLTSIMPTRSRKL